jgi:hypothetical protein
MDPAKDPTPGSGGRERGQHLLDPTYMTQERSAVASKFECSRILNFETQRPSVGQNEKVTYQPVAIAGWRDQTFITTGTEYISLYRIGYVVEYREYISL